MPDPTPVAVLEPAPWLHVLTALAPVVLIILLGVLLSRWGGLSRTQVRDLDQLSYRAGMPALLFVKIATAHMSGGVASRLVFVLTLTTLCAALLARGVGRLSGYQGAALSTFVQAGFRGNLAFVGLSVIVYGLVPAAGERAAHTEFIAVLALGPMVVVYNLLAVGVLVAGQTRARRSWSRLARALALNPLILACLLGAAVRALEFPIPAVLLRTLTVVGQMALPLALITLGASLQALPPASELRGGVASAVVKVALSPLLALFFGLVLALPQDQMQIALIYAASPTAVASYVLVTELGGNRGLAASAVVASTLLSAISISLVLLLTTASP